MRTDEVVTTGFVRKGRLEIRQRKGLQESLKRLADGEVLVTIARVKAARSTQQNRWYWGVIVDLLSEYTGFTPDEMHEVLKAKFLPKKLAVADQNGVIRGEYVIGGTTTKLDKVEFGEFCESVRRWAAEELDVIIPDPETGSLWSGTRPQRNTDVGTTA